MDLQLAIQICEQLVMAEDDEAKNWPYLMTEQAQEKIRALQKEIDEQAKIIRLAYERKTMLEEIK
jgi:RPA family protein